MKLITAIIKPFKLDEVREALSARRRSGHHGHRGQGLRPAKGPHGAVSRRRIRGRFLPKVKIEAALSDDIVERAIEAIEGSARTGKIGDGKVFVYDLEQVVRIRTGETGKEAL